MIGFVKDVRSKEIAPNLAFGGLVTTAQGGPRASSRETSVGIDESRQSSPAVGPFNWRSIDQRMLNDGKSGLFTALSLVMRDRQGNPLAGARIQFLTLSVSGAPRRAIPDVREARRLADGSLNTNYKRTMILSSTLLTLALFGADNNGTATSVDTIAAELGSAPATTCLQGSLQLKPVTSRNV